MYKRIVAAVAALAVAGLLVPLLAGSAWAHEDTLRGRRVGRAG